MKEKIKYENRVVAFIDILGFSQIIKETITEHGNNHNRIAELYEAFNRISELMGVNEEPEDAVPSRQVTQFSDSIVISFKISDSHAEIAYLINELMFLHIELAKYGILIRGGISDGPLIHTNRLLFGPALIHAYEVESLAAINPRIILPQRFRMAYGMEQMITADEDDFYYIDYFDKCGDPENSIFVDDKEYIEHLDRLKNIIESGLVYRDKPGIYKKYGWMKTKWNKTLIKFQTRPMQQELRENEREELVEFFKNSSSIIKSM